MKKKITVLDPTIREVGCLIDWQFSLEQAQAIARDMEAAGVPWIEMGHIFGLGTEGMRHTQNEYITAINEVLTTSQVSTFGFTGVTTKEHIKTAQAVGLKLLRLGFIGFEGPHRLELAKELIEYSNEINMDLALNVIMSHRFTQKDLERMLAEVKHFKLHSIYIVDSTGSMLPADVRKLVTYLVKHTDLPIGFHGHEQLRHAVANSIVAVEAGATWVDGTLLGAGRTPGNAQIEVLAAILSKLGYETGCDWGKIADAGEKHLQPLFKDQIGIKKKEITLAYYGQIGFVEALVRQYADNLNVSYVAILEELDRRNIHFVTEDHIKEIAEGLQK